jgi:hypothetical protein
MKYEINEITNDYIWDSLLVDINNSIFSKVFFLKALGIKYKRYSIVDDNVVKACFCILLDDNMSKIIDNVFVIHSGLYILENNLKNNLGRINNEIFDITSDFVDFITLNYKEIDISLNIAINDIRPFLWYNYFEDENKKFKINVKYTTILNLELLDDPDEFKTNLFLNFSKLRRRNIRASKKNNINFSYDIDITSLIDAHEIHLQNQNQIVDKRQKIQMYNLIDSLVKNNRATIQGTFVEGDLRYIVCYAYDNLSSYFLFGSPIGDNNVNYLGTASHFNMFNHLKKQNVTRVNMEGVNSPERGHFKLTFGGELQNYYTFKLSLS